MKPVYFFLGANSEEGFFSLYDQLLGGRLDDLMILKGGPGCGKSTFMRRMGAAMERAGERGVYINCSGDPDSLDAAWRCTRRWIFRSSAAARTAFSHASCEAREPAAGASTARFWAV